MDIFAIFSLISPIYRHSDELIAIPTKLGYILSGTVSNNSEPATAIVRRAVDLRGFLNLEAVPFSKQTSKSDPVELLRKIQLSAILKVAMLSDFP